MAPERSYARKATLCAGTISALLGSADAGGQAREHHETALGVVHFSTSCSDSAQRQFDHAVALLHHMTYPRARESFESVARADPRCAMAHWGIAMTLFQPLWPTRPGPAELRSGWDAAQRGLALAPTARERALVQAVATFFESPDSPDYWARIRRWDAAMREVLAAYPDDPEIAAFTALAMLASAPADASDRTHAERAAELLSSVYARNPDHPGAMHYLVHANDAAGRERISLEVTRKYETVAPSNPHALHMPTHIYTRLGDWRAVIRGNLRAADAALEHPVGEQGRFVWDEFPHAVEYLVYAYLQQGADSAANAQYRRLLGTARLQPSFKTAFHLASIPARYALERQAWREAAAIEPRQALDLDWDQFHWPEAVSWFARGLGASRIGDQAEARRALARIDALENATAAAGEDLFARQIRILRWELEAWIAQAESRQDSARTIMLRAAELEEATPKHAVTPAPALPAYELLGDLLAAQGDSAAAHDAYRRSLESYPQRFNSLIGAARAAAATGNRARAREYYAELLAVASEQTQRPAVAEARAFMSRNR